MKPSTKPARDRSRPRVLIVDDEPELSRHLEDLWGEELEAHVLHPGDLEDSDLDDLDVILVDFLLTEWPAVQTTQSPPSLRPIDGFALAAVLRSHALRRERPTAVALRTAKLDELAGAWGAGVAEHAIARANNLEWVFSKSGDTELMRQVPILARAVASLPRTWPTADSPESEAGTVRLLGLVGTSNWSERAWEDVQRCHPPLHELAAQTSGLAFLRWLLHRILPYPCFLMDDLSLAARVGVDRETILAALNDGMRDGLEPASYKGILTGFVGERWWRAGVESFLWDWTDGLTFDRDALSEALRKRGLKAGLKYREAVVLVDTDSRRWGGLAEISEAARIQPDDWPPYADQAWTTRERARTDARTQVLVVSQDRSLVEG